MTKFTDRLENDLSHIADQASPSPTAWDAIQQRMAEPEPNDARDIIMLTDEREQAATPTVDRRWMAVAAAVAIGVLAIGAFALGRGEDEDLFITDDPPEEVVVDGDLEEDSAPDTTLAAAEEAVPLLSGLPVSGLTTTDDLGMTLTFDSPEVMDTTFVEPGFFSLYKPSEIRAEIGIIVATRVGGWYDAEQAVDNTYRGEGSIAASDIDGWIEANQHIAERLPDATVSGRTTKVYDIVIDETVEGSLSDDCSRCVLTSSPSSVFFDPSLAQSGNKVINPGLKLRLWFIEVDGFDPIAIWAGGFGDDSTYIDEFETTILPTIEIGADAGPLSVPGSGPTPILAGLPLSSGLVQTDLLGETLLMELSDDMAVNFARPGEVQLTTGAGALNILGMARVGGWYSGTEAIDSTYLGEGSIDPGDPQAWIDDNGLIADRRPGFTEVSGRIATIWDITVDPAFDGTLYNGCAQCMLVYSVSSEFFDPTTAQAETRTINADVTMRMFFFEMPDGEDPFVFFAATISNDLGFLDDFEENILPTIEFEPAS